MIARPSLPCSDRIRLRPLSPADLQAQVHGQDSEIIRWLSGKANTEEEHRKAVKGRSRPVARSTGDERRWRSLALLLCPRELPDTGVILRHGRTRRSISFREAAAAGS